MFVNVSAMGQVTYCYVCMDHQIIDKNYMGRSGAAAVLDLATCRPRLCVFSRDFIARYTCVYNNIATLCDIKRHMWHKFDINLNIHIKIAQAVGFFM